MRISRRDLLLVVLPAALAVVFKCDEVRESAEYLYKGRKYLSPEHRKKGGLEGMKPHELRDQVLGAPITKIEYDSPLRPSSRER